MKIQVHTTGGTHVIEGKDIWMEVDGKFMYIRDADVQGVRPLFVTSARSLLKAWVVNE